MLRVLIPSRYDDLLDACLTAMEKSESGSTSRVLIGDNGLSTEFRAKWPVEYVTVPSNPFVYAQAANIMVGCVDGDLLFLDDGTRFVSEGWLTACENLLSAWPAGFGMLNLSEPTTAELYPEAGNPIESPTTLAFVGALIPRCAWDAVGKMDERFVAYGYEDSDLQFQLLHVGYKIGITRNVILRHVKEPGGYERASGGRQSVIEKCLHNMSLFYDKWHIEGPREPSFLPSACHLNRIACNCP